MGVGRQLWNGIWSSCGPDGVRAMAEMFGRVCPICDNCKQTGDGRVMVLRWWTEPNGQCSANMECGDCHHQWQVTK